MCCTPQSWLAPPQETPFSLREPTKRARSRQSFSCTGSVQQCGTRPQCPPWSGRGRDGCNSKPQRLPPLRCPNGRQVSASLAAKGSSHNIRAWISVLCFRVDTIQANATSAWVEGTLQPSPPPASSRASAVPSSQPRHEHGAPLGPCGKAVASRGQ